MYHTGLDQRLLPRSSWACYRYLTEMLSSLSRIVSSLAFRLLMCSTSSTVKKFNSLTAGSGSGRGGAGGEMGTDFDGDEARTDFGGDEMRTDFGVGDETGTDFGEDTTRADFGGAAGETGDFLGEARADATGNLQIFDFKK